MERSINREAPPPYTLPHPRSTLVPASSNLQHTIQFAPGSYGQSSSHSRHNVRFTTNDGGSDGTPVFLSDEGDSESSVSCSPEPHSPLSFPDVAQPRSSQQHQPGPSGSAIITPRLHAGSSMAPSSSRPVASRRRTDPSRSTTHRTDEPEDPSLAALMRHRATLTSRSARSASSSEIPTRSSSRRHAAAAPSTVPVSTEQTMPNVPPTSETQAMSNRPREETISSPYEPHLLPSSTSEPSPSSASSVPLPSSLATLIDANRAGPPDLAWDVRRDPRSSLYQWTYHGIFVPLTRHVHPELNQDATSPSINKLSIDSPLFLTGWEELAIESPSSITVWNILSALHDFLRKPLTHQEYAMIPRARRESLKQAFVSRVAHASQGLREREYSEGVRRVDYLMGQTSLIGFHLDSSGDGTCILQAAFASHDPEGVIPRPQPNRLAFTTPWYAPMPMMSPRYSPMPMPMTPIALTPRLFFGSAHHYN